MQNYNEQSDTASVSGSIEQGAATVASMTNAAGNEIAEVAGQAQHVARQQFDKLAETIRSRPLQATGIAVGIGFVLAMLARR
jgi:ElaB/YqjD/DUF883 family membrane-anchored ribosome-binding protein